MHVPWHGDGRYSSTVWILFFPSMSIAGKSMGLRLGGRRRGIYVLIDITCQASFIFSSSCNNVKMLISHFSALIRDGESKSNKYVYLVVIISGQQLYLHPSSPYPLQDGGLCL